MSGEANTRTLNSLTKLTVKTALIGSACFFAPALVATGFGIKILVVGGLFLYSGAVDNLINCVV